MVLSSKYIILGRKCFQYLGLLPFTAHHPKYNFCLVHRSAGLSEQPAWERQHWARTLGDECQCSSDSPSARREANRHPVGSSQAWRGLLDRVLLSISLPLHRTAAASTVGVFTLIFQKAPLQNLMSCYTVKCPATQYIVIHHTPRLPFVAQLLIWPENIPLIGMSFLSFSPFLQICQLCDSNAVLTLHQCNY